MKKALFILLILALLLTSCTKVTGVVKGKNKDGLTDVCYYVTLKTGRAIQVTGDVYYSVSIGQRCTFTKIDLYFSKVSCEGE